MNSDFSERLRIALKRINKDQFGSGAFLSRLTDVTPKAAGKWLSGESVPRRKIITKIAETTGVRSEWLEYGEGPQETINFDSNVSGVHEPNAYYFTNTPYPIIGWVQAGSWNEAIDITDLDGFDELLYENSNSRVSSKSFWLRVTGDSMTAPAGVSIPEGYLILVDPEKQPDNNDLVVAKLTDSNEATFKRLVIDSGIKYLKPLNPTYKTIEVNGNCRIIGTVREVKLTL